ncbi:MAG: phosphoenolpyruvate--protein phosphotransferase [Verrucomicrobiota bacterium]|nr:phosphoenolpyruvate--protein phosphotransferase [Verrucomicrobiota bacterium]
MPARQGERVFRGVPVSAGLCRGKVFVLPPKEDKEGPRYTISEDEVPEEIERFRQALSRTRDQIHSIKQRVKAAMGASDAAIFDAQLAVLDDPMLVDRVIDTIKSQKINAEFAFAEVSGRYVAILNELEDDRMRERAADMRDVTTRIMHNLLSHEDPPDLSKITEQCILVAYDLTPSQTALLDKKLVLGFATDQGSQTSHSAILARSLELPAVTGLRDASLRLKSGEYALLDGYNGLLIVNPTDQTLFQYGQLARKRLAIKEALREIRDLPAVTIDGFRVTLSANVEQPNETEEVLKNGAEGIGLFRTEYLFLDRGTLPNEDEQYQAYRRVAEVLKPQPVIIRTLDLGGDKFLAHLKAPTEHNPFMGWRAIRICLQEKDLFRAQLRAILRASVVGNVKMMYPMISSLDELLEANAMVAECMEELRSKGIPFNPDMEIGTMIEIPAAVMIADSLAKHARFFSIGTNDLIQYSLAVDRMNPKIAHLYEPTHPAVLKLIKTTVDAAHNNGIWVGVCGEMAADPVLVPLLLGLGVDELSAAPALVPAVKFTVRRLKLSEARALAQFALESDHGAEVLKRAEELAHTLAPTLWENSNKFKR